jgi:hypothetical protein
MTKSDKIWGYAYIIFTVILLCWLDEDLGGMEKAFISIPAIVCGIYLNAYREVEKAKKKNELV